MTTNPLSTLAGAELAALLAPVNDSLTKLETTPTTINVAAQIASLQVNLLAAAPVLEQIGIAGLASYLKAQLAAFEASVNASITPAAPAA